MSDACEKHGERAKRLIKAWSAIAGHEYDFEDGVRIPLSIEEDGYAFRLGGTKFAADTIDGAFDAAEARCRELCAFHIKHRSAELDKAMQQSRTVEEILK